VWAIEGDGVERLVRVEAERGMLPEGARERGRAAARRRDEEQHAVVPRSRLRDELPEGRLGPRLHRPRLAGERGDSRLAREPPARESPGDLAASEPGPPPR